MAKNFLYQQWPVVDFSGGINNKVEDNLIKDNQCTDAQNIICVTIGRIQEREGQTLLSATPLSGAIQGLHAYYYGDTLQNRKIIVASNGIVYVWNGTTFTSIKTGLSTTNQIQFLTCVNYMVGFDGTAPFKYDGTTVTTLANAPVTAKCPVLFQEKVFVITDLDTINWSDSFKPESWPGVNEWDFDKGDGDELSMIIPFGRELLACKKRSIFNLQGTSLDDFQSHKVESSYGVVGSRAGIVREPYFYYVSYSGIMLFNGLASINLTENTIPLTWANVNQAQLSKAVAGYNEKYNHLWFHLCEGTSTTNNMVLVYDLNYKSWWVFRGIEASCMMAFNDGISLKTYTGNYAGNVVEQNVGLNDMGNIISSYWQGKNFDNSDPVRVKKIKKSYVVDVKDLNDAVFQYRLNSGAWLSPVAQTDKDNVRKHKIPNGKCRFFQPKFTHSVLDQNFALSGMKIIFDPGRDK